MNTTINNNNNNILRYHLTVKRNGRKKTMSFSKLKMCISLGRL